MQEQDIPVLETYGEALIDAAEETNSLEAMLEEARGLIEILRSEPSLLMLLEKPAIRKDDKQAFVRRVFQGRVSPLMLHLPLLLVDKSRGGLWLDVLRSFLRTVERRKGIERATVSTACVLSDAEKQRLHETLQAFTGKKLRIEYLRNDDLLGGVLYRQGDTMIDTTIRRGMEELRRRLSQVRVN